MSNETDIRSFRKITHNFSPKAQANLQEAAKIHGTSQRQELMDALARNKRLAEIEMLGLRLAIVDDSDVVMGYVLYNGQDIRLEDSEDLPPNVVPMHKNSY